MHTFASEMAATEQSTEDDDGISLNTASFIWNIHEVIFLMGSHCFLSTIQYSDI